MIKKKFLKTPLRVVWLVFLVKYCNFVAGPFCFEDYWKSLSVLCEFTHALPK